MDGLEAIAIDHNSPPIFLDIASMRFSVGRRRDRVAIDKQEPGDCGNQSSKWKADPNEFKMVGIIHCDKLA